MEEEKKKTTFLFVFLTYLPLFLLKFWSRELVGCGIWFRIQKLPTLHTLNGPRYPKNKKCMKKCDNDIIITFFQAFLVFWGREVHQKYAVWVLVVCGIKFCIQRAPPIEIWVKTQWDMSKIRTKKIVFFNDKYVNSTIKVDLFYWNSIGSWIPTHKNLFWHVFL